MEERVYLCGWAKTESRFRLWLKVSPFSEAEGAVLKEAMEKLIQSVRDDGGAVTPTFEFTPPLPKSDSEQHYYHPELVLICGDERFMTDEPRTPAFSLPEVREVGERWFEQFFTGPCCRKCRTPGGTRNERQLTIKHVPSGYDGGSASLGSTNVRCFSESFLSLLTTQERKQLQPVRRSAGAREKFYELVGPLKLTTVAVQGLEPDGWRCPECNHRVFAYFMQNLSCRNFVSREYLPSPMPALFTADSSGGLELCMTAGRWERMVGQKGTSRILSSPLGIVDKERVICEPELKLFK